MIEDTRPYPCQEDLHRRVTALENRVRFLESLKDLRSPSERSGRVSQLMELSEMYSKLGLEFMAEKTLHRAYELLVSGWGKDHESSRQDKE